jgi:hypothetical protein
LEVEPTLGVDVVEEEKEDEEILLLRYDNPASIQRFVARLTVASSWSQLDWDSDTCMNLSLQYDAYLRALSTNPSLCRPELLKSETVLLALKVLTKSRMNRDQLASTLRSWERILGSTNRTDLTDHLSLRLLSANAKAGQVGRVLALLRLRGDRNFPPRPREFQLAVRSIRIAQRQHRERNLFLGDSAPPQQPSMPSRSNNSPLVRPPLAATSLSPTATASALVATPLDDPTRWLDAILLNMKTRNVCLTAQLASQMVWCYASGYTGRATHHFYRVKRRPLPAAAGMDDEADTKDPGDGEVIRSTAISSMPVRHYWDRASRTYERRYTKVHMEYNSCMPPFYKVPSLVGRQTLQYQSPRQPFYPVDDSATHHPGRTKLDMEENPGYSAALSAAFEFAASVRLGAAGHPGIEWNASCVAALVASCVSRGALWRAMQILDDADRDQEAGGPSITSYNILLTGLARVGDVRTMQDVTGRLLSAGLTPNSSTVRAVVTGLLNLGDVSSAITVVQDSFNQHCVLPPVPTLVTILEHSLASDRLFEAKRCLYFVQQLWKWSATPYHSPELAAFMRRIQSHPQLQRRALEGLFAYFGHCLGDADFI